MENSELFDKEMLNDKVLFSLFVQQSATQNETRILDVLSDLIETYDLDQEDVADALTDSVKGILKEEFIESGMMKRENTLEDFFE